MIQQDEPSAGPYAPQAGRSNVPAFGGQSRQIGRLRASYAVCVMVVFFHGCGDESRVVPFQPSESTAGAPQQTPPASGPLDESPILARTLAGERSIEVEGATLASGSHRLRALLLEDVDADGDRDALVLAEDEGGAVLLFARRDAERFSLSPLARERFETDCEWGRAETSDAGEWRSLTAQVECGESRTSVAFLIKAGSTPRLVESLSADGGELEVALADGLSVQVRIAGASATMRWTEGAGAFALDAAEVASAIGGAEGAAQLERAAAWCGSSARVRLRGAPIDCSADHRHLADVQRALLDGEGGLGGQLRRLRAFGEVGQVAARRLCAPGVRVEHVGPAFESPPPRYSALFYRDGRLFDAVRERFHPAHDGAALEPAVAYPSPRGGELVDEATGEWISTDPAAPRIPLPPGEWTALAWAPQGLVAFDGTGLQLVPIRDEGPAAPRSLSGALPAPLRGARASTDGETWAAETAFGVLVSGVEGAALWCLETPEPILAAALHAPSTLAVATASGIYQLSRL